MRWVVMVAGGVVAFGLALVTVIGDQAASVPAGLAPMPASFRALYVAAAATCPGLPAEVLMAIGEVESGHGPTMGRRRRGRSGRCSSSRPPSPLTPCRFLREV